MLPHTIAWMADTQTVGTGLQQTSSLTEVFRPLALLAPADLYADYWFIVDLAIYLLVFVGAAQVTLGSRFPGRGGRALTAGIGVMLAVSMLIAEQSLGFNLQSFGPAAASVLLLLFGVMVHRLLAHAGLHHPGAAALAYVAVYLFAHATAPGMFDWLERLSKEKSV